MSQAERTPDYLSTPDKFLRYRLGYYQSVYPININNISEKLFPENIDSQEAVRRMRAVESLKDTSSIVVVTATKDRLDKIKVAHEALVSQQTYTDWQWLVVDNGSSDATVEYLESLGDSRIHTVTYVEQTGCAYPARNFGLDILHFAFWRKNGKTPQILIVDSDDHLFDNFSLHELKKMQLSSTASNCQDAVLFHGFAVCEYTDASGNVTYGSHPHDISSSFPEVNALVEVFDKGLNILAGMYSADTLDWLRYPAEFSFEDNGFNHKLLLQALKRGRKWLVDQYPITTKTFHNESMASRNDKIGDTEVVSNIGEHTVTGIRSTIVSNLAYLADYFQREDL